MSNASHQEKNVLVLDGDTLPALAIIRSLGRKKINVTASSHQHDPISRYSKYTATVLLYPHPLEETEAFLSWLRYQLESNKYQLIIPATERTLVPIARQFHNSEYAHKITMPDLDALERVLNKSKTTLLANQCHVPLPKSWNITKISDLDSHRKEFTYPIVIKPGRSISDNPERTSLTVCYAHTQEQLLKICTQLLQHTHLVLQSYFTGTGIGVEIIADHGEILYSFQHQRLHEMPLSGGGSSYRKSVDIDPILLEASKKLIKALNWQGVAMVEFKKNLSSGEFILIEINGRFWGSLPLATAAGADFPYMLYQLYTDGNVDYKTPYRRNITCRKLSSDLRWLEAVARKDADTKLVRIPSLGCAVKDLLHIFSPKHFFDVQSFSDLKPGLIDIKLIICSYTNRFFSLFKGNLSRNVFIKHSHCSKILPRLKTSKNILFLCYGNINRSALAHVMAEHIERKDIRHQFKSAGFHPQGGRPSDPRMVKIAENKGLDMKDIRSTVISEEIINWADMIFVMEAEHLSKLSDISESAAGKTFLLGGLTTQGKAFEISDPYNKPLPVYESVYAEINTCIENLYTLSIKK